MAQNFVLSNSLLRQEYELAAQLFSAQPALTQRLIEAQARQLAEAIVQRTPQTHFTLPTQVVLLGDHRQALTVPAGYREQTLGGAGSRLSAAGR